MALTRTTFPTKKLTLPADLLPDVAEGDWVEIYTVYTAGMRKRVNLLSTVEGAYNETYFRTGVLSVVLHRWSDEDVPITVEAIDTLPVDVQDWIVLEWYKVRSGLEMDEDAKKNSITPSSPPTSTGESSPASSAT